MTAYTDESLPPQSAVDDSAMPDDTSDDSDDEICDVSEADQQVSSVIKALVDLNLTDNRDSNVDRNSQDSAVSNAVEVFRDKLPPVMSNIEYRICSENDGNSTWQEATVLNRAGKASGKNKLWMNIEEIPSHEQKSLDFGKAEWKFKEEAVLYCGRDS